jgi:hypothetical protein
MNDSFMSPDDMKESFMTLGPRLPVVRRDGFGQKPLRPLGTPTPVGAS